MAVNRVMLLGNLGKDPETRYTAAGAAVVNFSLATNESYKDKDGEKVEKVEWHNVVAFERTAEIIGEYCHKGSKVLIFGKLQTRKWQDKEGNDKYTTEIVVDRFNGLQLLDSKPASGGFSESAGETRKPAAKPAAKAAPNKDDDFDSDIPF